MKSTGYSQQEHEHSFIESFIVPNKRVRALGFIDKPLKRFMVVQLFYHFQDLDTGCFVPIESTQHQALHIKHLLTKLGAPPRCWVMSNNKEMDAQEFDLEYALNQIVGSLSGTVVSCIPGKLAYLESEQPSDRFIMQKS